MDDSAHFFPYPLPMNTGQRLIIAAGATLLAALWLVPPWQLIQRDSTTSIGHFPIWRQRVIAQYDRYPRIETDRPRLLSESAALIALTFAAAILSASLRKKPTWKEQAAMNPTAQPVPKISMHGSALDRQHWN